ncbi:hypothetical protein V2E24_03340 [Mycoplasmopsis ciconiae]|uniref:Uncharacterized protein n=1 Tax=Mycoplasmopsis ciconiae TaxID=561067 RepID=A0ABU7MNP6_9BACT|nr:hypothetical protein [Mycoplasmopsis ciconiae]
MSKKVSLSLVIVVLILGIAISSLLYYFYSKELITVKLLIPLMSLFSIISFSFISFLVIKSNLFIVSFPEKLKNSLTFYVFVNIVYTIALSLIIVLLVINLFLFPFAQESNIIANVLQPKTQIKDSYNITSYSLLVTLNWAMFLIVWVSLFIKRNISKTAKINFIVPFYFQKNLKTL